MYIKEYKKKLRLNCSFYPLTFTKLRFWSLKKKLQNDPLSFASVVVLAPKGKKKIKKITRDTSLRVSRQRRPSQNWYWGPKLPQMQNLENHFVVFFRDLNRNFAKVRGVKTVIKPKINCKTKNDR